MIVPRFIVVGARDIRGRFIRKALVLDKEIIEATDINARRLVEEIRIRASGRPGPNVQTGAYRDSWYVVADGNQRIVTTDAPQARRLELGFSGVDSLGRVYDQPPFPHVRPAADAIETTYVRDMIVVANRGI